ncbi:prohead protease inhibitor [Vibrio phage K567]
MNEEYLKGKTKREVIEFQLAHTDIEYDKTLTKSAAIRLIMANVDKITSFPDDYLDTSVISSETTCDLVDESDAPIVKTTVEGSDVELEVVISNPVEHIEVTIQIQDEFKPKWTPSYRHEGELFQVVKHDDIHAYLIGNRDTHELQTIAYWVALRGELLVRDNLSNSFVVLG